MTGVGESPSAIRRPARVWAHGRRLIPNEGTAPTSRTGGIPFRQRGPAL